MQAIVDTPISRVRFGIVKKRGNRDYMMRSEKREGSRATRTQPPKKPRRNWFYLIMTLLALLILYPVGLFMLWTRRFRASAGVKMAISLVSVIAFICVWSFGLTVEVNSTAIQNVQTQIREVFAKYGEENRGILTDGEQALRAFPMKLGNVTYQALEASRHTLISALTAAQPTIDSIKTNAGPAISGFFASVGDGIKGFLNPPPQSSPSPVLSPQPGGTAEPATTPTPTPQPTPSPTPRPMAWYKDGEIVFHVREDCDPYVDKDIDLEEAIELGMRACKVCASELVTPTPTAGGGTQSSPAPSVKPFQTPPPRSTPTPSPTQTTDVSARAPGTGASFIPEESPTATPTPSPAPTTEPATTATAQPTQGATPTPTAKPTANPTISPTINPTIGTTINPAPTPTPSIEPTLPPETAAPSPTPRPTQVATPPPTPSLPPTPAPAIAQAITFAPAMVTPEPTLAPFAIPTFKPMANSTVWHTQNGKYYHTWKSCSGMVNASRFTLQSSIEAGFGRCSTCASPDELMMDEPMAVWCGSDKIFHITDECAGMTEQWTALSLAKAIEDGYLGCDVCKSILFNPDGSARLNGTNAPELEQE